MSSLRRRLRGWSGHSSVVYKQQKASLQGAINDLDVTAEVRDWTNTEREQLAQSQDQLTKLLQIKFYQRTKVIDVLLGDNNTKYFQMVANSKHRKKMIFSLDQDEGKIEGKRH